MGEEDNDDGQVEVWSTDSKDDKVHRPTRGACYVAKEVEHESSGKCFFMSSVSSESQAYVTDEGTNYEVCFSIKTV